jgi:hypothetical protein
VEREGNSTWKREPGARTMTRSRKKTRTTVALCRAPPSASLLVPADSALPGFCLLASTSLFFFCRLLLLPLLAVVWFQQEKGKRPFVFRLVE